MHTICDVDRIKCRRAIEQTGTTQLIIAGGVSANKRLRAELEEKLQAEVVYAPLDLCTDNGAMVAITGFYRLQLGQQDDLNISVKTRWPITEIL